ncbi:TPA: phage tail spike protein, partial [Enterococcus faecium]
MIDNLLTIYDKNDANNLAEHLYDTQGLGALSDWLTATVSNKLNGAEIFQGTYSINGTNADLIVEGRIIQCYVDENRAKQRLRIYYAKTSVIGNTIEVKAEPIFNDIRKSVLNKYDSGTEKITATQAWQNAKVLAKPAIPSQFSFSSLVDTLANVKIEKANFLEFFGGKEGSILDRFHGEFLKDNNTLRHEKSLGTDHKIKAIYTKNLTGLDLEIDAQSVLVGVYPFIS